MPTPVKISGSRSAAVLGLSPYQTPVQVWLSIQEELSPGFCADNNYELPVFEGNASTRFGQAFENEILNLTEIKYGKYIRSVQDYYEENYLSCHVDGIMIDTLIEAKTTTDFGFRLEWGEPGTDRIPVAYQCQIQHNLYLTGLKKCILPLLIFPKRPEEWEEMGYRITSPDSHDYKIITDDLSLNIYPESWAKPLAEMGYLKFYEIDAHPQMQNLMLEKYKIFWENNVLGKIPPEPVTYDDIRALVRDPVGTIVADEEIIRLMAEFHNIKSEIGQGGSLAKRAEQIKVEVLKYMQNQGTVIDDDSGDKWILRDQAGKKIAQYNGKVFR